MIFFRCCENAIVAVFVAYSSDHQQHIHVRVYMRITNAGTKRDIEKLFVYIYIPNKDNI